MMTLTQAVETFPFVHIASETDGLPIEVTLIAQLGHGAGNHLYTGIVARQRKHPFFVDELDEPSAKLGATDFLKGDATALYSFAVGPNGHPFHRHAGHRIFTAVSGSGGAQLRFSTASADQIAQDPRSFIDALRYVNIPADCLFTVRFGGETWHQFAPLLPNASHPAFFALSCHTNELGGHLSEALKEKILADRADIPTLTELLPPDVQTLLQAKDFDANAIPTAILSLDAPAGTFHRGVCSVVRRSLGRLRGAWGAWTTASGFLSFMNVTGSLIKGRILPPHSLLRQHFRDVAIHHEDTCSITVSGVNFGRTSAHKILASVLEGFLMNAPRKVRWLMAFRNFLVRPLGLRTSPLGCPVSSLLSERGETVFANRYPVLDQSKNASDRDAQVILGADDKHLRFRSCVSVRILKTSEVEIRLENRVHCRNAFGRVYMAVIDRTHRHYIAPAMLTRAVAYATARAAVETDDIRSNPFYFRVGFADAN